MNPEIVSLTRVIDAPTATVILGDNDGRHFLAELTVGAVATYLALKYVDGFIEGLGLPELGKRHGAKIKSRMGDL